MFRDFYSQQYVSVMYISTLSKSINTNQNPIEVIQGHYTNAKHDSDIFQIVMFVVSPTMFNTTFKTLGISCTVIYLCTKILSNISRPFELI